MTPFTPSSQFCGFRGSRFSNHFPGNPFSSLNFISLSIFRGAVFPFFRPPRLFPYLPPPADSRLSFFYAVGRWLTSPFPLRWEDLFYFFCSTILSLAPTSLAGAACRPFLFLGKKFLFLFRQSNETRAYLFWSIVLPIFFLRRLGNLFPIPPPFLARNHLNISSREIFSFGVPLSGWRVPLPFFNCSCLVVLSMMV